MPNIEYCPVCGRPGSCCTERTRLREDVAKLEGSTTAIGTQWRETAEQLRGAVEAGEAMAQALERHPFVDTRSGPSGAALTRWRALHPEGQ